MKITDFMKVFSSARRMEVLDALYQGQSREEIRDRVPGSTYAFTIDTLKKAGMIRESDGEIVLTDKGRAYLLIFEHAKESIATYTRVSERFNDHIIDFPEDFFPRLYEIDAFEVITSEPSDVLKPHRIFSEYIRNSSEIYGVSPLLFPDYPQLFGGILEHIDRLSLVVTDEILGIISEYPLDQYENIEIYIINTPPKIAITVTDTFLSIGFFYRSGNYDFTRDLVSIAPSALRFGRDLVDYYKSQSRRIV